MSQPTNAAIQARDLTKTFTQGTETIHAVHHTSFDLAHGEFAAITGQSGSGKTTLLNILGCITLPDSGTLLIGGENALEAGEKERAAIRRQKIGYVFQDFKLLPALTVTENIMLPLRLDGKKPDQDKISALLQLLHIDHRAGHFPSQLSGGEKQRAAIARALAHDPDILLADEPTGNLDSRNADEIVAVLHQLHQAGRTILMVTHNQQIALSCPRRLRIHDGVLREE